jgi:hypothetical protein
MYGYENKSGLLGSTVVGFVFFRVLMLALQYFIKLGRCGFYIQSPPPLYLTKAIS